MKVKTFSKTVCVTTLIMLTVAIPLAAFAKPGNLTGTWSGTFQSDHRDMAPFTITVVYTPDANGHLVGKSDLESQCVKGIKLQVTTEGSDVVLAGSDEDGDSLTFRGTMDASGTLMNMRYIANGSASGRCETDRGAGTLGKR